LFPPLWRLQDPYKWYVSYVRLPSAVGYCMCYTLLSVIVFLLPLGLLSFLRSKVSLLLWRPVGRPYYYCVVLCCVLYDGGGLWAFPRSVPKLYTRTSAADRLKRRKTTRKKMGPLAPEHFAPSQYIFYVDISGAVQYCMYLVVLSAIDLLLPLS